MSPNLLISSLLVYKDGQSRRVSVLECGACLTQGWSLAPGAKVAEQPEPKTEEVAIAVEPINESIAVAPVEIELSSIESFVELTSESATVAEVSQYKPKKRSS
jgi:hypothetical protein